MNRLHHWICGSAYWRRRVEAGLLPWALDGLTLGAKVLELGPGYGTATVALSARVADLICVELDAPMAQSLAHRAARTKVRVIQADATLLPFPKGHFSAVVCFTMLHHLPTAAHQDRLFAEVARVLSPGGIFAGTDSLSSLPFRLIHIGDTLTPIDPDRLPERLGAVGLLATASIDRRAHNFRFHAIRATAGTTRAAATPGTVEG